MSSDSYPVYVPFKCAFPIPQQSEMPSCASRKLGDAEGSICCPLGYLPICRINFTKPIDINCSCQKINEG